MSTTDLHREFLHELKLGKLYSLDRPGRSIYSEPDLRGAILGHIHHGNIVMMIGKHIDPFGNLGKDYNTTNWVKVLTENLIGWAIVHEGDWANINQPDYLK
jgi:hypothetical protein